MSTDISMNRVSNTQTTQTAAYNASPSAANLINQALRECVALFIKLQTLYEEQAKTISRLMGEKALKAYYEQLEGIEKNTKSERVKAGWGLAGTGVAAGMGIAGVIGFGGMQLEHAMPFSSVATNAMNNAGGMHGASLLAQGQRASAQAETIKTGLETDKTDCTAQKDGVEKMYQQIHAAQNMMFDIGNQFINALRVN